MNVYYISGHLDLSQDEFERFYREKIDTALNEGAQFVVGDARGADAISQSYLLGKTDDVTVYHMFSNPRNNAGFKAKGGFSSDKERDCQMTLDSTHDIAWVRPGRERSGTARNLKRRAGGGREASVGQAPV
ncbi:hypothetical protein KKF91_17055 [Myxococcota bacterium]|nr:hypothetical protein [Myxococcota bacterium]MBU1432248.1 hypothetical protein [Myxococcota bacterium]MBU1900003.1 hypothetical protein [Myxococcota bacterium]